MDTSTDADSLLQSAVNILSRDVPTPRYSGVDIKPVKAEIAKVSGSRDQVKQTVDEATKLNTEATAKEKEGYTEDAAAKSEAASALAARDARVAAAYDAFSSLINTQQEVADSVAAASKFIIQAKPGADAKLQTVQEMQAVGFMDNPLEWAYNQIQLPAKIKDYNKDAVRINSAQDAIDSGIKNVGDIAAGASKSIPNTTSAMAAAAGHEAVAKAKILSANADENLARINVDFASKKLAGDIAVASQVEGMTRIQQQDAQARFQAQVAAIAASDTHANRLINAAKLSESIADNKQMRDVVLANYDRMTGRSEGTTTLTAWNRMPPQIKADIMAIGGSSSYGQPYDALISLRTLKTGDQLPDATKRLMGFLSERELAHEKEISENFAVQVTSGKMSKADESQFRKNALNEMLKNDLNAQLSNPDKSALFRAPNPSELIAAGVIKVDSPLGKILEPLTKTTTPITADILASQIFTLTDNPTTAGAMLSDYYKASRKMALSASNISAINGVQIPSGYTVYAKPFEFSKPTPFNLEDPAQATRYGIISTIAGKSKANEKVNRQVGSAMMNSLPSQGQ